MVMVVLVFTMRLMFLPCSSNIDTIHVIRSVNNDKKNLNFFILKNETVEKSLETLFFCRLDEGRASEGQVIAGSPPQVILVEMIHGNILIFFYCF